MDFISTWMPSRNWEKLGECVLHCMIACIMCNVIVLRLQVYSDVDGPAMVMTRMKSHSVMPQRDMRRLSTYANLPSLFPARSTSKPPAEPTDAPAARRASAPCDARRALSRSQMVTAETQCQPIALESGLGANLPCSAVPRLNLSARFDEAQPRSSRGKPMIA